MRLLSGLLIALCGLTQPLISQTFETVRVGFTRTVKKNQQIETAKGEIYFDGVTTTIIISDPIRQWMRVADNITFIYYPEEQRALKLTSQGLARISFFQAFSGLFKENFGLPEAGFRLEKNVFQNDTLWSYWLPPESMKKYLGHFIIGSQKNKFVKVAITDHHEKPMVETFFKKHVEYKNYYFPMEIAIIQHADEHQPVENVKFHLPEFDTPLPDQVLHFQIPPGINVMELEW